MSEGTLEARAIVTLLAWQWLAGTLARRRYEGLPRLLTQGVDSPTAVGPALPPDRGRRGQISGSRDPSPAPPSPLPVSVIIPARDEAAILPALLASLATALPPVAQILVVDDQSGDDTAKVARAAGATVITVPNLPLGWTGKTHACHLGALSADQPWLLFLDADTTLGPRAVSATLPPLLIWRAWRLGGRKRALAAVLSYGLGVRNLWYWQRLFRAGHRLAFAHPLAALVFQGIACESLARVGFRRGVIWKGRTYR